MVNEGVIIANAEQGVILSNANTKLILELPDEGAIGWKVTDLLRGNEHLINAYYKVESGSERQQELLNTVLVTKSRSGRESLAVNFRVYAVETAKGESGDVLVLIQPVPKVLL